MIASAHGTVSFKLILLQSDAKSLSGIVPSILSLHLQCHLQQIPQKYPSTKTAAAMLLKNELHKRFQPIMDVNSDSFNLVPPAACLLDLVFAQVLFIPEQAPLLRAAKLMVISMCDNAVAPATAEAAAMIDSKSKEALAEKFSFQANKLQAATSTGTLSMVTNQETVQGQLNRYISDLTETNLDTENAIEFWSEQMAIYKLIGPLALDLLSAPASQAFVERIFSLCGLMTAG